MKTNFRNRKFSANNFFVKNRKGAIEMSMTTIVTIVLVVVTLVLALVLINTIFRSGQDAIEQVDTAIQDQINKLFASEGKNLAVYPASRQIIIKKGDIPKGFAFSVKNPEPEVATFTYSVAASDFSNCGSTMTKETAEAYMLGGTGTFDLGVSGQLDLPRLVKFDVPESAPACTIIYTLQVSGGLTTSADIYVTIE